MDYNQTKTSKHLKIIDSIPGYVVATDEERLAQLGPQQELKRHISLPTLGALCLCLMATWEATSTVIAQALLSDVCITSSLGEIASIYPTAGGQYHWVAVLCPPSSRSLAAFATGWISVGGLIVFCASAAFAAGLQTQSLIIINDDSYIPRRWQGLLFYWAVLLYSGAMNIWGSKLLSHANMISGVIHVVGFVTILILLGVMAPKNTASFVFTKYDAAPHMAEEIYNAPRNVPIAMVGSIVLNGLMGLTYCTVLLFSTGSLDSMLTTATGFLFMQTYLDVTKSRAGSTVLSLLIIVVATAASVGGITSASRTLWAFARDKAVPFDASFSHINERQQVPVMAIAFVTSAQMGLGFLYLGNTTAFNAVLSKAIIGIYLSYSMPIAFMLLVGRKRLTPKEYGPFRLAGVLGPLLNVISLIWMAVVILFSTFPSSQAVTAQNMNYSTIAMAGWLSFGLGYYFIRGHAKFEVPIIVSDIVEAVGHC
ncbi:amino acid permease [Colletotrichum incanum]|uniref:Amino acid permease n=1 Tax=Colletotrichum incanum TaxID=1573173 RepID=A0A166ZWH3_COLIC|nr:amino acid permease [Colletotrichum incanum]